jgi:ElaB/YqjD/DUF883 family membrane-anchored ribosome-binding protein
MKHAWTTSTPPFLSSPKNSKFTLMKNRIHKPAQTAQELMVDLRNLVVEAEKMAANSVSEYSQDAFTALRDRYEAAQDRLSSAYDGAKKRVAAGAHYTDVAIHEKPYHALAIVAGVAVLVGLLVGGRRSR